MAYESVDSSALRYAASQCEQLAANAQEVISQLQSRLASMTWTGPAADEFAASLGDSAASVAVGANALREASCELVCAAETVETAHAAGPVA